MNRRGGIATEMTGSTMYDLFTTLMMWRDFLRHPGYLSFTQTSFSFSQKVFFEIDQGYFTAMYEFSLG